MKRLALIGVGLCLTASLRAQEVRTPAQPGPIAESADRLARQWWPDEVTSFTVDEDGRPRFRTGVTEEAPPPPWAPSSEPGPTRYRGAISHQEMLAAMTPPEFSVPPLVGASVDPGSIYHAIKDAWREWQARRIHERVTRELQEFLAATDTPVD